jgi:hypothetical protein
MVGGENHTGSEETTAKTIAWGAIATKKVL